MPCGDMGFVGMAEFMTGEMKINSTKAGLALLSLLSTK